MRRKESRAAVSRPSSPAGLGFFSEEAFVPRRAKRSPAADAGLECRRKPPQNGRTGGSGGHFALGIMAPRRPFCPLSAGGKWTNAPQRFAAGALFYKTASVAAHSGSLRHDAGTRRRSPLCGQTAKRGGVSAPAGAAGSIGRAYCEAGYTEHTVCEFSPSVKPFGLATSLVRGRQDPAGDGDERRISAPWLPCGKTLYRKKPAIGRLILYSSGCLGWVLAKSFASHCSTRSRGKYWLMSRAAITPTPVSKMRLTA